MAIRKQWHIWRGGEHIETVKSRVECYALLNEYRLADPAGGYYVTFGRREKVRVALCGH